RLPRRGRREHNRVFGFQVPGMEQEFHTYRVRGLIEVEKPCLKPLQAPNGGGSVAPVGERVCVFRGGEANTKVYRSQDLFPGATIQGPAVIEAATTTVVVPPQFGVEVDGYGNIILIQQKVEAV
ncbi:MAG: hypothetical protein M1305_00695, partial [Candidatus Marsarchaeota archaeon]|nr:hypothetical protein [Candidatus Marsarchaeota archaeon]